AAQAGVIGRIAKNDRMLQRLAHRLEPVVGRERVERVEIERKESLVAQDAVTIGVARRNPEPNRRPQQWISRAQELVERVGIGGEEPAIQAASEAANLGKGFR